MRTSKHLIAYLAVIDTVEIGLAMALSYYFRIAGGVIPYHGPQDLGGYIRLAALIMPVWLVLHAINGLYSPDLLFEGFEEYSRVIRASSFGIVALIVASFWERPTLLSRGWVLITWCLCIVFVTTGRFLFRKWAHRCRARGCMTTRSLIVGAGQHAITIARQLRRSPQSGSRVIGFLDDHLPLGSEVLEGLGVIGSPGNLEYLVDLLAIDEVIIVPEALAWESLQDIARHSAAFSRRNVRMRLSPGVYESITNGANIYYKASIPMVTIQDLRVTGAAATFKNIVDYCNAFVLLFISLPFMALAALALALVGSRPILDCRKVVGLKGAPFTQLKFHTGVQAGYRRTLDRGSLRQDAHSFAGRVARVLYSTGFDKAPQLWNVLRGEMSLVGARPVLWGLPRGGSVMRDMSTVKPGMTGLWALTGDASPEYELASTLYYIRRWSLLLDIQILAHTIFGAVSGRLRPVTVGHASEEIGFQNLFAAPQIPAGSES
jgi:lipopolysaccharide/colanic/teichoic acid biosynthesis glycosyltransferase